MSFPRGVAAMMWLTAASAGAHGLSAGVAEVQLRGRTLFVMVAPSADAFLDLDSNADGRLSADEVAAQRSTLQSRFAHSFIARDLSGAAPALGFFDVGVPVDPLPGAPAYVRFTAELSWPEVPSGFTVSSRWPELWLEAVRVQLPEPGRWVAMGKAESVRLRADGTPSPPLLLVPHAAASAPRAASPIAMTAVLFTFLAGLVLVWRQRLAVSPKPGALL